MEQGIKERILAFIAQNKIVTALIFFGIIFLIFGGVSLFASLDKNSADQISIEEEPLKEKQNIKVDIEGAVQKPGVYELKSDQRIKDILVAAGGLSADADRDWVAKSLNQAQKLIDGVKIYIPKKEETVSLPISSSITSVSDTGTAGTSAITTSSTININNASSDELDKLPSIGPVTAQKIIDSRPYNSVEDLLNKKVVGQKTFDKIKDLISVF